ncbi:MULTISPECIES: ArsR/SmtB family transcription factor [Citrobacter]|uniref:ArsR/SmtB family transcription factor n=1 Tax=Citrobacter TaxID=544 RepID=UPI000EF27CF3|nr:MULTISPECIES: winged helix-turn-helix domain-containing protein [Citrobacter]AYL68614.1 transcriptional regulator [Citrobacter werkmanii]MBJ8406759.1 winged helix-turn-helix transcriptional regulator [Citrobacter cronae]MBU5601905.1 winged helix-turn-helix domain-containing protein [Citrobacter sp. S55_ASV_140]MDE9721036.1 winged helix-turn-helix domain-containing protein [Citrobacter cronae]
MKLLKTQLENEQDDVLETSMAMVASALSDPSRVSILCALMDGRAWTATELSVVADIAASTTSGHLNRLLSNGLVICLTQGRHRYYSLADQHIAGLLENLMGVSMLTQKSRTSSTPVNLRYARTCYDHLAGELAVSIYEFMLREKWLEADGSELTLVGKMHFERMGVLLNSHTRRKPCCPCMDWSERRFHLGGNAGSALLTFFLQKEWITRTPGYREVNVTDSGKVAMYRLFELKIT